MKKRYSLAPRIKKSSQNSIAVICLTILIAHFFGGKASAQKSPILKGPRDKSSSSPIKPKSPIISAPTQSERKIDASKIISAPSPNNSSVKTPLNEAVKVYEASQNKGLISKSKILRAPSKEIVSDKEILNVESLEKSQSNVKKDGNAKDKEIIRSISDVNENKDSN